MLFGPLLTPSGAAMNTLLVFVVLYLMISVSLGLYAATRVKNSSDYANAGRSLPLPVVMVSLLLPP